MGTRAKVCDALGAVLEDTHDCGSILNGVFEKLQERGLGNVTQVEMEVELVEGELYLTHFTVVVSGRRYNIHLSERLVMPTRSTPP